MVVKAIADLALQEFHLFFDPLMDEDYKGVESRTDTELLDAAMAAKEADPIPLGEQYLKYNLGGDDSEVKRKYFEKYSDVTEAELREALPEFMNSMAFYSGMHPSETCAGENWRDRGKYPEEKDWTWDEIEELAAMPFESLREMYKTAADAEEWALAKKIDQAMYTHEEND